MGQMNGNATADRALDVLAMFDEHRREVSAHTVGQVLGVGRSTAYRYLASLSRSGLLAEGRRGQYLLGPRILDLARLARPDSDLSQRALPVMRELVATGEETVILTRLIAERVVCVERVEVDRVVRISYERGAVFPLNAGAASPVLLSGLDDDGVRRLLGSAELPRFTPRTVTDPAQMLEKVRQARLDGYAISAGELDNDVVGVAVPIHRDGAVVAAVGMVALASHMDDARIARVIDDLVSASVRIAGEA